MAEIEEIQEEEETCEERSLNLLKDSKIDQEFSEAKARKRGARKHKLKRMSRPMAIPQVILELLDHDLREDALRSLSHFLIEKRKEDPENYHRAGYLFFNSCATMTILIQEITNFFGKMANESLNIRSIKRLVNVLHLFQTVAANNETRQKFVDSAVPNFLIPLILYKNTIDHYDNLRAVSLSVIGILCQGRERQIIMWAVENDMVEVCQTVIHTGSELSKVIAMHILESIMQDGFGLSYVCDGEHLLKGLMETWDNLVSLSILQHHSDFWHQTSFPF
ncbi:hypothetical protein QJS04_geneDACA000365 [Acorus gramineus]|uniref:Uncharacterized protein n=1 Tax=Acorus gramineus TaxID=55184 RepID=A0AAV9AT47_ACOGR|nr:hypothetical protein QJS04_geneDACA000365 [Acorus gramineus]